MNNLVKIGEAARRLDVSSITLRRLERGGAIPQARRHPRTGHTNGCGLQRRRCSAPQPGGQELLSTS